MSTGPRSVVGWITGIAVVISVSSYFLVLVIGVAEIALTDLGSKLAAFTGQLGIEAFLLVLWTPLQANGLFLVIISLVIFGICFVKSATSNDGFRQGLRLLLSGSRPRHLPNWLATMPLVSCGLFAIVFLLTLIQSTAGISTGNLTCPPSIPELICTAQLFASVTTAPVAEEFGFRITTIGLVVAISIAIRPGTSKVPTGLRTATPRRVATVFSAFLSPGYAKEKSGLPSIRNAGLRGISVAEWTFLIFTSAVFGAYHVLGGGGWGPGKFLTSALSGFTLGVVYLAYGAFADILLHWFFNFYFEVFIVNTPFIGVLTPLGNLVLFGCFALGVWVIAIGIYWLTQRGPAPGLVPLSNVKSAMPSQQVIA